MNEFFVLEPEVAGGLGPNTVMDRSVHPPRISHLHYVFDGWLGDDILESFPAWIVTSGLADRIRQAGLSGVSFKEVEVSVSDTFRELHPEKTLPRFERLIANGMPQKDDFGIGQDHRLVASERALGVIRSLNASNLMVEPIR